MKKFLYGVTTIFLGLLIHVILNRYMSFFGVGPHFLLLLVVCHGFLLGPLMGETMGFVWGLILDSIGVNFFGMQSLLFAFAGYVSGKLRRRVASERPTAQLVVAVVVTLYYFLGSSFVKSMMGGDSQSLSWLVIVLGVFFNVLIVIAVFWIMEWWIAIWGIKEEKV